jgi:hypothetical protein
MTVAVRLFIGDQMVSGRIIEGHLWSPIFILRLAGLVHSLSRGESDRMVEIEYFDWPEEVRFLRIKDGKEIKW